MDYVLDYPHQLQKYEFIFSLQGFNREVQLAAYGTSLAMVAMDRCGEVWRGDEQKFV